MPTRLLCPWNFPGKNIGVGCHFLLQGIFLTQGLKPHLLLWQADSLPLHHLGRLLTSHAAAAKSLQSCPTLCDPIDGSPPGSPVPGIFQARKLEWVAISFSHWQDCVYVYFVGSLWKALAEKEFTPFHPIWTLLSWQIWLVLCTGLQNGFHWACGVGV